MCFTVTILGLTLSALLLRIGGIAQWDFVYDEFYTLLNINPDFRHLVDPDGTLITKKKIPLFYWLTATSVKTFGMSEWALRLPSVLLGVISIPIFILTWKQVLGRRAALFGALLLTVSTWHLWYSQLGRFYAGVFLFGSLCYYFYYLALRKNSLALLFVSLVAHAIGIQFHLSSLIVAVGCGAFSLSLLLSERLRGDAYSRRIAIVHLGIYAAGFLVLLPQLASELSNWNAQGQTWGYGPLGISLQLLKWTQAPIAIAGVCGLLMLLRKDLTKGLFFAAGIGVPLLLMVIGAKFTTVRADYVFYCVPLVLLMAGYLCEEIRQIVWAGSRNVVAATALPMLIVFSLMPELISHYTSRSSLHISSATKVVENAYRPGDRVIPLINRDNFFRYYAEFEYPYETVRADPLDASVQWNLILDPYKTVPQCAWIVTTIRRQALSAELESWLLTNASLVWRQSSNRYDYKIEGYQLFVAGKEQQKCRQRVAADRAG